MIPCAMISCEDNHRTSPPQDDNPQPVTYLHVSVSHQRSKHSHNQINKPEPARSWMIWSSGSSASDDPANTHSSTHTPFRNESGASSSVSGAHALPELERQSLKLSFSREGGNLQAMAAVGRMTGLECDESMVCLLTDDDGGGGGGDSGGRHELPVCRAK
jgi:hypothetical protein